MQKVVNSIKTLTSHDVFVGYPSTGPARDDGPLTNAYIAFIQEHGSPVKNIPARPFMVPGVMSIKAQAIKLLEQAAIAGLQGNQSQAVIILNQLGLIGVSAVQRAITRGEGWQPLSPRTLAARRRRGVTRTHPLIDTGSLRQHVEYVIRTRPVTFTMVDSPYISNLKK